MCPRERGRQRPAEADREVNALFGNLEPTPVGLQADGRIISRCGLVCNTCTAFLTGACLGCDQLSTGDCVIRDCADLQGTSCLDCQASSCYHFEAYPIRRQLMNARAKRFYRLLNPNGLEGKGCGSGGGCSGGGGCGGCLSVNGSSWAADGAEGCSRCPVARWTDRLQQI